MYQFPHYRERLPLILLQDASRDLGGKSFALRSLEHVEVATLAMDAELSPDQVAELSSAVATAVTRAFSTRTRTQSSQSQQSSNGLGTTPAGEMR